MPQLLIGWHPACMDAKLEVTIHTTESQQLQWQLTYVLEYLNEPGES